MGSSYYPGCCGITRRGFLLGAGAGLAAGVPLTWLGLRGWDGLRGDPALASFRGKSVEIKKPEFAMPGRFPGQVVEVHNPLSVRDDHTIEPQAVKVMMDRGMCALTGADHPEEAWKSFFTVGDVVGVKVNPVGRKRKKQDVGSISSPAVVREIVNGLLAAGVKAKDIIIFERYANEFIEAKYDNDLKDLWEKGVTWLASAAEYDGTQWEIDGFPRGRAAYSPELAKHVVGYDPDVFMHMGFATSKNRDKDIDHPSNRDERRYRSHLSVIATRLVNKVITIPVLKDHRSGGVTMALKNLSHGFNNNVARSHLGDYFRRTGYQSGPNQCNTFIPTAASHESLRKVATLHIMDGLIGVYEGGPGSWNASWGTWPHQSLFFATDPVAMDHVGWDIIDIKRVEMGWPPVAHMGLIQENIFTKLSRNLAALAAASAHEASTLAVASKNLQDSRRSENFDRRQPEHVILAETIGLGIFDANKIRHQRIELNSLA
ncbi:MAG: DUF362 domain-containing protein [Gemmataceae bacterium]